VHCAPAEVNGGEAEGFVHGHQKIACAHDAAFVAEGLVKGFSEGDADVFDGVVLVDVEVAFALEVEIEGAMAGEEFEHVIEKPNAS